MRYLWFGLLAIAAARPVYAGPPVSAPGCNLSAISVSADIEAFKYCLQPSILKSDFDNFSLASVGLALFPGNATAISAARAWYDQIDYNLLHGAYHIGSAFDTGSWSITRDATKYSGGNPPYVNSAFSATTNVGPNALSSEWAILGRVANSSVQSQSVGVYGQGYNYATGTAWGMVAEAYAKVPRGTAVGIEVDAGGVDATTNAIGIDIVNTGKMRAAVRVQPGVCALASSLDAGTCIMFNTAGGIDIYVRGAKVQSY
jgi:hypothetical protein